MANFGTDSTTTAHDGRRSINLTMINGGLFGASAGTLDSVTIFGDEDGGGFNNYRLAVYQGGTSDTNPAGATLVWDSGEQTCPAGAAAWRTVTAGGQALAASTRTWVAVRTSDEFHPHYAIITDEDDATYNAYTWSQNNSATSYEATVPAVSLDGTSAFKWYLTFTVGGGGTTTTTTLTSTATVTDQSVTGAIRGATLADALVLSDATVFGALRNRLLQDAITVDEGPFLSSTAYGIVADDAIDVGDSALLFMLRRRLLEDGIDITDEALASLLTGNVLVRILSDTLGVSDESLRYINRSRLLESFLLLSDETLSARQRFVVLSDLLVLSDEVTDVYTGEDLPPEPVIVIGFNQPKIVIGGYRV